MKIGFWKQKIITQLLLWDPKEVTEYELIRLYLNLYMLIN